jgi:nucleoside-diphosphate-sugar epimerase
MRRALVTGGSGFIGRHVVARLVADDWDVDSVDVRPRHVDVTNIDDDLRRSPHMHITQDCRTFFETWNSPYDLVVHAAAVIGGRTVIEEDPLATAVNLELDAAMFRWAARAKPSRVVYISSSAVYPVHLQNGNGGRLTELDQRVTNLDVVGVPDQTYGWSKLVGEHLAGQLRREGVPVTVVRPFSGYGVDQDKDYPFPAFIHRARRRANPFVVWGDGQQIRDFVHVDDIVGATLAAVDAKEDGPINVCTGEETSFDELASICHEAAGYRPEVLHDLQAPQGVRHRVGDPTTMLKIYTPQVQLEDVIWKALKK